MIKHYRVDKMRNIVLTDKKREGRELFNELDLATYASVIFGMFGGEITRVKLQFENGLVGVLLDRFGREIPIHPADREGWSETSVDVAVSDQFFGWIFALGAKVEILGPKDVRERFKRELESMGKIYKG